MRILDILISLILGLASLGAVPQKTTLPTTTHQAPQTNVQRSEPKELDNSKAQIQVPEQRKMVCQDGAVDMGDGMCRFYTGCVHGDSLDVDKCDAMGF